MTPSHDPPSMDNERLRWVARMASKPLHDWAQHTALVRRRGYALREEWACPVVGGVAHDVRLTSAFPDARKIEVRLYRRGDAVCVRSARVDSLAEGVACACDWLEACESNLARHPTLRRSPPT